MYFLYPPPVRFSVTEPCYAQRLKETMQPPVWDHITPVTDGAPPIAHLEIKLYCQTLISTVHQLWARAFEVTYVCVQAASASARKLGLRASTGPFTSHVCVEDLCGEALMQPNAPESPEIYNNHTSS